MPLYARAGAVIPIGPVRQYADEPNDSPTALVVYPGADVTSVLCDDDGISFDHRRGDFMKIEMAWQDNARRLTLRLARGSRMLPPNPRRFEVRIAGTTVTKSVVFNGRPVDMQL
jgi:alpha-glucosidase/alpha-D-xyloside xylohydrolase